MTVYQAGDRNPLWIATIEKMIQRLSELAVVKGGGLAYIPLGGYEPGATLGADAVMPTGIVAVEGGNERLIQGLGQYYKATGYEPALNLAAKLTAFLRAGSGLRWARPVPDFGPGAKVVAELFEPPPGREITRG
jgi:hypothetical protein